MSPLTTLRAPTEQFLVFDCDGDACVGIVAIPTDGNARRDIGVVIVIGGPQYRVGSHRQFVMLSRALAEVGLAVFRFDYRGMGDSEGDARTFESVDDDLSAAITALQRETGVANVVLWGLCDGASAAIMYAANDPRIAGIVAVNPWARSPQGEASTRLKHYYLRRLLSRAFWRKVLTGKVDVRDSRDDFVSAIQTSANPLIPVDAIAYLRRMQESWSRFQKPILFILSGYDYTAREFEGWVALDKQRIGLFRGAHSEICAIENADHTFSSRAWHVRVAQETIEWIQRIG